MRRYLFAIALALSCLSASGADAESCKKPLTLLTSLDLVPVSNETAPIVPVQINGTDQIMLVDTGAFFGMISPNIADKLGIPRSRIPLRFIGVSGKAADEIATADTFKLGRIMAQNFQFVVENQPIEKLGDREIAGTIGANILKNYDMDLDMGAGKLNILSQDHCKGRVIYWSAETVAAVPIEIGEQGHITIPVTLDGKRLEGLLDTGSSDSVLVQDDAELDFGLKMGTDDTPADGVIPGTTNTTMYRHRFKTLSFEGVTINNPEFEIMPDLIRYQVQQGPELGSRIKSESRKAGIGDVIIGMNVLRHLHLYIAYGEHMLYITPGTVPAASATQAKAAGTSTTTP